MGLFYSFDFLFIHQKQKNAAPLWLRRLLEGEFNIRGKAFPQMRGTGEDVLLLEALPSQCSNAFTETGKEKPLGEAKHISRDANLYGLAVKIQIRQAELLSAICTSIPACKYPYPRGSADFFEINHGHKSPY